VNIGDPCEVRTSTVSDGPANQHGFKRLLETDVQWKSAFVTKVSGNWYEALDCDGETWGLLAFERGNIRSATAEWQHAERKPDKSTTK
jgi:hypothetical protein